MQDAHWRTGPLTAEQQLLAETAADSGATTAGGKTTDCTTLHVLHQPPFVKEVTEKD